MPRGGGAAAAASVVKQQKQDREDARIAAGDPLEEEVYVETARSDYGEDGVIYAADGIVFREKAFFVLGVDSPPRKFFIDLVQNPWFDRVIMLLILLNCITMGMRFPNDEVDPTATTKFLMSTDMPFLFLYSIEMFSKIMALGFCLHKHSYLRGPKCAWNWLDFVVVSTGWAEVIFPALSNYSALRAFRALRPLRTINRVPSMKILVATLLGTLRQLGDVCILCTFMFLLFAIVGLTLFQGLFHMQCHTKVVDPITSEVSWEWQVDVVCGYHECEDGPEACQEVEQNPVYGITHFDTVGAAFMAIQQCFALDGCTDNLAMLEDAFGPFSMIWSISLIAIGTFFMTNLFLAVLCDCFLRMFEEEKEHQKHKAEYVRMERRRNQTAEENAAEDDKKNAKMNHKLSRNNSSVTMTEMEPSGCVKLVHAAWVGHFFMGLILLNTFTMCLDQHDSPPELSYFLEKCNIVFTLLFAFECVWKWTVLGSATYLSDNFNIFDVVVVVSSLVDLAVTEFGVNIGINVSILRTFRLMRILRLARSWKGLQQVLKMALDSLVATSNLMVLMMLLMYIMALLAMQLFGGKFTPEVGFEELPRRNYEGIGWSFLHVFITISGSWWDNFVPCHRAVGWPATVFYLVAVLGGCFIVLNLFVVILLSNVSTPEPDGTARTGRKHKKPVPDSNAITFGMFKQDHEVRLKAQMITTHPEFDSAVMWVIFLSSIAMALDSPRLDTNGSLYMLLRLLDIIWTVVFTAEMLLKMISVGLWGSKNAYINDSWNRLDGFIVFTSWLGIIMSMISDNSQLTAMRALRALRALRPLRMISTNASMRHIVDCLFQVMPQVATVGMVVLLFMIIFAILGIQLFKGKMSYCGDESILDRWECQGAGHIWVRPPSHFDHMGGALLALYIESTLDDWEDLIYRMVDANQEDMGPVRDYNQPVAFFLVAWIVVGGFFTMNMFVGAIIDGFNGVKKSTDGMAFMTQSQKEWVEIQRLMNRYKPAFKPTKPKNSLRKTCYNVTMSKVFEPFVMLMIMLNVLVMAMAYYKQPQWYTDLMDVFNMFFTLFFLGECILKLTAFFPRQYFKDAWNCFDFMVVSFSVIDILLTALQIPFRPTLLRVLRMFRAVRLLRLIKHAKGVRVLIATLVYSLPSLGNVCALMALILFIYALLGMQLFFNLKLQEAISADYNFMNFPRAYLTTFRIVTGEHWASMMTEAMVTPVNAGPGACSYVEENCGSTMAIPFFISANMVVSLVFLNIIIAVILDNFAANESEENRRVTNKDMDEFNEVWQFFDQAASNNINADEMMSFVTKLSPPLGVGQETSQDHARQYVLRLNVETYESEGGTIVVDYVDVMSAIIKAQYEDVELDPDNEEVQKVEAQRNRRKTVANTNTSSGMANQQFAVKMLRANVKMAVERIKQRKALEARGMKPMKGMKGPGSSKSPRGSSVANVRSGVLNKIMTPRSSNKSPRK